MPRKIHIEHLSVQTGDVCFEHTYFNWKNIVTYISVIVRLVAKVFTNHVGIAIEVWGQMYVLEAKKKVVLTPFDEWCKGKYILIRRPYNLPESKRKFSERLLELKNKKYDYWGCWWHQLVYNITGVWIGAESEKKALERPYCYEVYWYAYKKYFGKRWYTQKPEDTVDTKFTYTHFEGEVIFK